MQVQALNTSIGFLILLGFLSFRLQVEYDLKGIWLSNDENSHIEQLEFFLDKEKSEFKKYNGKDQNGHLILRELIYDESDNEYSGKWVTTGGHELSATVVFLDNDTIKITIRRFLHRSSFTLTKNGELHDE